MLKNSSDTLLYANSMKEHENIFEHYSLWFEQVYLSNNVLKTFLNKARLSWVAAWPRPDIKHIILCKLDLTTPLRAGLQCAVDAADSNLRLSLVHSPSHLLLHIDSDCIFLNIIVHFLLYTKWNMSQPLTFHESAIKPFLIFWCNVNNL